MAPETQEMVFDAHDRAFALFKGTCGRGIYDNMKTAVETVFAMVCSTYGLNAPSHPSGQPFVSARSRSLVS